MWRQIRVHVTSRGQLDQAKQPVNVARLSWQVTSIDAVQRMTQFRISLAGFLGQRVVRLPIIAPHRMLVEVTISQQVERHFPSCELHTIETFIDDGEVEPTR
jgi:hypothetical protein